MAARAITAIEVHPKPQRRAGLSPVGVYRAVPIERGAHERRPSSTALSGIGPSHSSSAEASPAGETVPSNDAAYLVIHGADVVDHR
jgi:hypothetical protein